MLILITFIVFDLLQFNACVLAASSCHEQSEGCPSIINSCDRNASFLSNMKMKLLRFRRTSRVLKNLSVDQRNMGHIDDINSNLPCRNIIHPRNITYNGAFLLRNQGNASVVLETIRDDFKTLEKITWILKKIKNTERNTSIKNQTRIVIWSARNTRRDIKILLSRCWGTSTKNLRVHLYSSDWCPQNTRAARYERDAFFVKTTHKFARELVRKYNFLFVDA